MLFSTGWVTCVSVEVNWIFLVSNTGSVVLGKSSSVSIAVSRLVAELVRRKVVSDMCWIMKP